MQNGPPALPPVTPGEVRATGRAVMAALREEIQELAPLATPRRIADDPERRVDSYGLRVVRIVGFSDEGCLEAEAIRPLLIALHPRYACASLKGLLIVRLSHHRREPSTHKLVGPPERESFRYSGGTY